MKYQISPGGNRIQAASEKRSEMILNKQAY